MSFTTVYLWGDYFNITGHAALSTDDYYVSFHPEKPNWFKDFIGQKGCFKNYEDDKKNHISPKKVIKIDWLDTDVINTKFEKYIYREQHNLLDYELLHHNCSTLVAELLCAGASEEFHEIRSVLDLFADMSRRQRGSYSNLSLFEIGREILEDINAICHYRNISIPFTEILLPAICADIMSRSFVWVPGDIEKFATRLASKNHNRYY